MSTNLTIDTHDTPADLYDALARAYGEQQHEQERWVRIVTPEANLSFFAPREAPKEEAA